jgi:hypothetical protein
MLSMRAVISSIKDLSDFFFRDFELVKLRSQT